MQLGFPDGDFRGAKTAPVLQGKHLSAVWGKPLAIYNLPYATAERPFAQIFLSRLNHGKGRAEQQYKNSRKKYKFKP